MISYMLAPWMKSKRIQRKIPPCKAAPNTIIPSLHDGTTCSGF